MFNGTPAALPLMPAKLDLMSPRTTPDELNTVGPFDPSAGYGPSVSSGMRLHVALDVGGVVVAVVVVAAALLDVVVVAVGEVGVSPQPANCNAPKAAPKRAPIRSKPRRSSVAFKSRCNPPKSS
jgi:hypothetical protein